MEYDVLVSGATGNTGSALVSLLRDAGVRVAGMTSRQARAEAGAEVPLRYGDLRKRETLAEAFRGARALYLVTPLGPDETAIGLGAIEEAERAGVEKIVYLSIMNLESMREIPHFETKIPIVERLQRGRRHVVLAANFFMQNDFMAVQSILQRGVYPLPVGRVGVRSVDVADIAQAACTALTDSAFDGELVPLAGPDRLTGPLMAATWASRLGRRVVYGGDDLDGFIRLVTAHMPVDEWTAHDMRKMMEVTQRLGCPASADDLAMTRAILGREPGTYAAAVERMAAKLR